MSIDLHNADRNWPEDYGSADDNGCYGHTCRDCGLGFIAHKRRPNQCRKCAAVAKTEWDALTPEEQAAKESAFEKWMKAQAE